MIMADGPAGIRLRQSYQVERKTGEVYGIGVLGALENGFLEPEKHYENADEEERWRNSISIFGWLRE